MIRKAESGATQTPMMQQYLLAKERYAEEILFFRMGDFYEMFFDDAVLASQVLELTLTARNKNDPNPIPMAGVPHHASAGYIQRLVDAAIGSIPDELFDRIENLEIIVRARPTPEELADADIGPNGTLLGLYQGQPLSSRGSYYGNTLPDHWEIEMGAAVSMSRRGWTPETIKAGDEIKVVGQPSRAPGTFGMCCAEVTKPDGSPLR